MIDTEIWDANPDKPGYLKYYGQVEIKTITEGIKNALEQIVIADDGLTAAEAMEWLIGPEDELYSFSLELWPENTFPIVTVKPGANEGWLVVILALNWKTKEAYALYTLKYLSGRDEAWKVAAGLDRHFEIH